MHSLFLSIFIIISSIQISLGTIISSEINQSFALINNKLIGNSIELDDILESGNYGFSSLKFNKEKLKFSVEHTLKDNYPNINYNIFYYFYDVRIQKSCNIYGSICNGVQIKFIASYKNIKINKIKRFEISEKK